MIGLMVLGVFGLYVLVSIIVVTITYRTAKSNGAPEPRVRRAAGVAALVMYLLLFWDWVPTVVAKQYYCRTQGGFSHYKTLDQWKAENPGVAETLVAPTLAPYTKEDSVTTFLLNQRFAWEARQQHLPLLSVIVYENRLVDRKTGELLARQGNVGTGDASPLVGGSWKVWLDQGPCDGPGFPSVAKFEKLVTDVKKLGGHQ
jgi:hypothetical protein